MQAGLDIHTLRVRDEDVYYPLCGAELCSHPNLGRGEPGCDCYGYRPVVLLLGDWYCIYIHKRTHTHTHTLSVVLLLGHWY
jgi:hypothetical protein